MVLDGLDLAVLGQIGPSGSLYLHGCFFELGLELIK